MTAPAFAGVDLKTLRRNAGLAQSQLARLTGAHRATVSRWERGDWPTPAGAVVICLAWPLLPEAARGQILAAVTEEKEPTP